MLVSKEDYEKEKAKISIQLDKEATILKWFDRSELWRLENTDDPITDAEVDLANAIKRDRKYWLRTLDDLEHYRQVTIQECASKLQA